MMPAPAWKLVRQRLVSVASAPLLAALLLAFPLPASAHFFIQSYSLPIPFWMYAWGAAGALLLSFMAAGIFASVPGTTQAHGWSSRAQTQDLSPAAPSAGGYVALGLLVLCIASGFAGPAKSVDNFNMTFFWIIFVLGVPYITAFIGDFYARMNPWETLVVLAEKLAGKPFTGRLQGPERWGHWPALILYGGFIHLELFGHLLPRGVSGWLLAYTGLNVAGAWLLGRRAWFQQGEFFAVLLRLLGKMAPLEHGTHGLRLRMPFSGLWKDHPKDLGLVVFILFMLSSTAFDGLHATKPWVDLYWSGINPLLTGGWGLSPREQNTVSVALYQLWQPTGLAAFPFIYLVLYAAIVLAMKAVVRSGLTLRELLCKFAFCLVPIAFVYHVTHYFTLLFAQGGQILRLVSDPLGVGWNVFGTGKWVIEPLMIDMGTLWHTQVGLILAGHVASVWVAHVQALTMFETPGRAALSQLPMLALMMAFTAFGLWILSLPLAAGG
ncbi:MAG TPA: hypothetical protein VHL79_21635 [Ramlibacter sp.]|jgi:hypothetical protein|nr:hypothetical protein [Ramlibacter sp.]